MMPKFGVPTEEQLSKINKLAKRTLSADEVFVFPDKLAGDMIIPDRHVRLMPELLQTFLVNAQNGVSVLLDHSWHADGLFGLGGRPRAAIPYGRTFDASLDTSNIEGETVELNADHYMVRGMTIDGISTDDLITGIEAGTLFDSSIGFNYNKAICSVCGNNYHDSSKCEHYVGRTYEVEVDGVTKNVLCYIQAYPPGALWENSLVFDGAYPTAGVLSKEGDIFENENGVYQVITELKDIDPAKPIIATYGQRTGLLTMIKKCEHKKLFAVGGTVANDNMNSIIQKAKNCSYADRDKIFALGNNLGISKEQVINIANIVLKGDGNKMNEKVLKMFEAFGIEYKEGETKTEELLNQMAEKYEATIASMQKNAEPLNVFMTQEQVKEKFGAELSADDVLKFAKEGQEYHKQVIEDAIAMGVRVQGNDFPAETWKNTFATMNTQAIKDIMKTFEAQAEAAIPAGRQTNPAAGLGKNEDVSFPDEAFKV